MALPNPIYIDQNALHPPAVIRGLAYGITTGAEGVWGNADLRVTQLGAASNRVQVLPGGYSVRAKHLGGAYEAYTGKIDVAEQSPIISNVPSGMTWRYDLVILQIQNPYVSGSGSWPVPADAVNGPYAQIVVVENVAADCWHVSQYNDTWEAITLARIRRPANSTIVTQDQITDLRSLAALGGTRTVVEQVELPPIAQAFYMQFKASEIDPNYANPTGGTDNAHDYLVADTTTKNWPVAAFWQVPVPDWAVECDAEFQVFNAQILDGDVYGDLWLDFGGTATTAQTYAIDYDNTPGRWVVPYGLTFTVPNTIRGKIVTVRTRFRSRFPAPGKLDAKTGTTTRLMLNFQRKPDS